MLKEVAQVNPTGKRLPDQFIYIDLESVEKGILRQRKQITKEIAPSRAQRSLVVGDVLFQTVRPYQQNNLFFNFVGEYIASTGYAQIRSKEEPLFLYYYLHTAKFLNRVLARCTGSNYPAINSNDLENIRVSLPSFPEQKKIAEFLGAVDEWVQNLRAQKESLEAYKKGIMQKLFSQEIRFKDENGKDFPAWEEKKLVQIATFLKGKGIAKNDISEDGKSKCIRYGELYTDYGEIIKSVKSRTHVSRLASVESEKGDVLIPSSGETALEISTACCVQESGVLLGGDLNILRFKDKRSGEFFAYFLTHYINRDIAKLAQGNAVVHLYASSVKLLKVNIPLVPEQEKIAEFLTLLDNQIVSKQQQITDVEIWKRGLMQCLFI
ncbi:restriction endonuclease subunit S [Patescibacteria group bacterium]|nr:restriction endonuclease subunit S [Patescibacteria group bacterium]